MSTTYSNERQGRFATEAVADEFDLVVENDATDWYDAVNPRNGTKYEVKSATKQIGDEYPAEGRFRLWEDQHRSLVAAGSNEGQSAWYVFVLLDDDGEIVDMRRMRPSTVTSLVGGWNRSGHDERESAQHKIPWDEVIDS